MARRPGKPKPKDPLSTKLSRAERRQSATKKVDHMKSVILLAARGSLEETEQQEPKMEEREQLKHAFAAARGEAENLFKQTDPQDRHLVRRAVHEVSVDMKTSVKAQSAAAQQ